MNERIRVRYGIWRKIIPVISLILVAASVVTFAVGVLGIGRVNNKEEREREEFLSKPYIEETIEAVFTAWLFGGVEPSDIVSVTYLQQSNYFSVTYVHNYNKKTKYFDSEKRAEISEQIWQQKVSNILSYLLYIGGGQSAFVTVSGDDLDRVITEVTGE